VLDQARNTQEALAVIESLPNDAAVFFVPTPSLEPISMLIEVAVQHGIAVGSNHSTYLKAGGVVVYAADFFAIGQQAARLADQILNGIRPSDLPVEAGEHLLNINLQAATVIGLNIPDAFLRQATLVKR
jgi:putative tryptophan/tyrosine transport system substrate-binding protein